MDMKRAIAHSKDVADNFHGSYRVPHYIQLVDKLPKANKTMKCNFALKIHFLLTWTSSLQISVQSMTNTVRGFTTTLL